MLLKHTYLLIAHEQHISIHAMTESSRSNLQECLEKTIDAFQCSQTSMAEYCDFLSSLPADHTEIRLDDDVKEHLTTHYLLSDLLNNPFVCVYLIVPDHWVTTLSRAIDLSSSFDVHVLAGLALASEMIHLDPDLLCYRFSIREKQYIEVHACSVQIVRQLESLLTKPVKLDGLIRATDCLDTIKHVSSNKRILQQLPTHRLSSYQQKVTERSKTSKKWILLLFFLFSVQVSAFAYHDFLSTQVGTLSARIAHVKNQQFSLPSAQVNESYRILEEMLGGLSQSIRFNSIRILPDVCELQLTGSNEQLKEQVRKWQSRWPEFLFQLHVDESDDQIATHTSTTIHKQTRTRSVHDAVVKIRSSATNS